MISLAKHSTFIFIFLLFNIYTTVAQPQSLNNSGKIKIENSMLWADTIEYDSIEKKINANGRVRVYIKNKNGIDMLFSDGITYSEKNGVIRAKGGRFNLLEEAHKENNQNGDGLLRLQSKYLIFFQNIEINRNTGYIKGENIKLRQLHTDGGFTARKFETKKRKNRKEDWIFYKVRYTKCLICADKKAKIEAKKTKKKKVKKKSSSIPLWRIDASKLHFENFTNENKDSLKPSARVHMHNARINIYGVPILYTPYFSYPRFGQRASGLLTPIYSLGGVNGYSIAIPMFWAPHKSFDATYVPKFTTTAKDTSRIELRSAFAFGGRQTEKLNKNKTPQANKHLISFTAGASIPHAKIGSGGQANFFAYTKASWLAPKGLRANAQYNFFGKRNYLYEYGQGLDVLSQYAPTRLLDLAGIEHFSRNGYANLSLQQQRELHDEPRADALLLPEISYENAGTFAANKRGNAKWAASLLWRGAVRKQQDSFEEIGIPQSENLRQDLVNSSIIIGWQRYLGAGFYASADAKLAINYWQQKLGEVQRNQWQILPEAQIAIEALYANNYNKGATILYLKPMLEIYSTLQNIEQSSREQLNGQLQFYDEQKRIGQQMPFDTALDGGQRLLSGLEFGVRDSKGSAFSLFLAPSVKWQQVENENQPRKIKTSGNLNVEAKGSWSSHLSFAYDAKLEMPEFSLASQKASVTTKYGIGNIELSYKELYGDTQVDRIAYDKSLTLTGEINAFKKWRTNVSIGYNFLRQDKPFNNIAVALNYDGSCFNFKLKYYRYFYSGREDDDSINFSFSFDF